MQNRKIWAYAVVILLTAASFSTNASTQLPRFLPGRQVGILQTTQIKEASGIVASRRNSGVLWVHNDSGGSPRVYAINPQGDLLAIYCIKESRCLDWEDIAIGPGPDPNCEYLYIGDIGDNTACRPFITIYRIPEPKVDIKLAPTEIQIGPADSIKLMYPDEQKDAETLMVDPLNGDIYIVPKREFLCRVYRAPYPQSTEKRTVMNLVGKLSLGFAVGGDISPDGKLVIVRGIFNASMWVRPEGAELWQAFSRKHFRLELMHEPQGEGICFSSDGHGYFTIGEMLHPPIYYFGNSNIPEKPEG